MIHPENDVPDDVRALLARSNTWSDEEARRVLLWELDRYIEMCDAWDVLHGDPPLEAVVNRWEAEAVRDRLRRELDLP